MIFRSIGQIYQSMVAAIQKRIPGLTYVKEASSIISNILYAFASAVADVYTILQNIYNAIFISLATGQDLDNRAADYGITREQPTYAQTYVTLSRSTPTPSSILIPAGTVDSTQQVGSLPQVGFSSVSDTVFYPTVTEEPHVFITNSYSYKLNQRFVDSITLLTGKVNGLDYVFVEGVDYFLNISNSSRHTLDFIISSTPSSLPDLGTIFYVTYIPLSVEVLFQAINSGASSNVGLGALTYMATIPSGIEDAYNYDPLVQEGFDEESDISLRSRIQLNFQALSKATTTALISAARSVAGVQSAVVIEPEKAPGYIIIVIDDGTGTASDLLISQVQDAIVGSLATVAYKAAGIVVNVQAPILVQIYLSALISTSIDFSSVVANVKTEVSAYINGLQPGASVIRSKIVNIITSITGVTDIDVNNIEILVLSATPYGGKTGNISLPSAGVPKISSDNIVISEI